MESGIREATRLLKVYTAGSFDFWVLAGPAKASCRAHIASVLAGKRVPQSKAGVTVLREQFHRISEPAGDCLAARERSFEAWARQILEAAS